MNKLIVCLLLLISTTTIVVAQTPTIGLLQNDTASYNGYTLFSPNSYNKTYLIDNCGYSINTWQSAYSPGLSVYLLPNGNLLRTAHINNSIFNNAGGSGGRLEIFNWAGNMLWSMNYSDSLHHQHHDVEYLPNGNILILAWEYKTFTEAINSGRNPVLINNSLWPEHIVEIEPTGVSGANIVWEWHVWDHLIQDFDSTKANFGLVQNHPELININYTNSGNQDWLHANSIKYNPAHDQIMLSIHNFSEIWVIDHSTNTSEAGSHSGGNSGKGGDLLYRWGNPRAYKRGTVVDQKFWGQHNAHWIDSGLHDEGKIMVFNNGFNRPGGNFSSIDIFEPPMDSAGNYSLIGNSPYLPDSLVWQYVSNPLAAFYSSNISGAQRLSNGNTLICEGSSGNFFEIDTGKNTVWNYINPLNSTGPLNQGSNPIGNSTFRCHRYSPDFSGFIGQTLSPGLPIELNPYPSSCSLFNSIPEKALPALNPGIMVFPNPVTSEIMIQNQKEEMITITISDLQGRICEKIKSRTLLTTISVSSLQNGIYLLMTDSPESHSITRIIKQ